MTAEEREMFDDLVAAIEANHERVVGKVHEPFQTSLAGDAATADADDPAADAAAASDDGAADDGGPRGPAEASGTASGGSADAGGAGASHDRDTPRDAGAPAEDPGRGAPDDPDGAAQEVADEAPPDGFVRVRVVEEVPGFVGTDGVEYDPSPDDVLTLPEENADALCDRGAAEPFGAE